MLDKLIKESYMMAPFEESKTSPSDHNRKDVGLKVPPPRLILQESTIDVPRVEVESPSPSKPVRNTLISFEIKHHEVLKKEDYVVSKLNF
jgi:hypothetical protein